MKIITYFILLVNLIVMILSKSKRTNALSKSKSKSKQYFLRRRPFGYYRSVYSGLYRPSYTFMRRSPVVYSNPLLVPLSSGFSTCPMEKGRKTLIGKSSGNCRSPCNLSTCIQLSFEGCIYSYPRY